MVPRFNQVIYIAFFFCVIALLISIHQCSTNHDSYTGSQNYIASLNDTLQHLKNGAVQKPVVELTRDGFVSIALEREDIQQALRDANIKARNVKSYTGLLTAMDIKKPIEIKIHDSIPCPDFEPVPFRAMDKDYRIDGKVGQGTIWFDTINFPDSVVIITATRSHLFRKNEYNLLIRHSNPMVQTIGAMNITISEPRKWYESAWLKIACGFATGSYLTYKLSH